MFMHKTETKITVPSERTGNSLADRLMTLEVCLVAFVSKYWLTGTRDRGQAFLFPCFLGLPAEGANSHWSANVTMAAISCSSSLASHTLPGPSMIYCGAFITYLSPLYLVFIPNDTHFEAVLEEE